jgi:ATP-binding cassette, subfamily B, bacterial MsbA
LKGLGKILRYLKNYKKYAAINVIANALSIVFNVFSLVAVIPFLNVLFPSKDSAGKGVDILTKPEFHISGTYLSDISKYYIQNLSKEYGVQYVLILLCVGFVAMMLLKNLFRYIAVYNMAPIRNGVIKDLRNEIYDKILVLPLSYYSAERKGDIMARMTNDLTEIEWSVMQSLEMISVNPLNIIFIIVSLVILSPHLTLVAICLLPVIGFLIYKVGGTLRKSSSKSKGSMGVLFSMIEETIGGIRIIRAFTAEKIIHTKFREENNRYTAIMNRVYRRTDLASPLTEVLVSIVSAILIYIGGHMVWSSSHLLDGAVFITYIILFSQVMAPAKAFSTGYYNIEKGLASLERIDKILHAEITVTEVANPRAINTFQNEIEFKNVGFAYLRGDSGYALKNINLKIPKGKTIAIVGQSGSGKSTLVDMLPRFYDPTEGFITIDGAPLNELSISQLRNLMGIVTQDTVLFNDTVKNNIAFGMKNITDEQVMQAAKVAHAHEFISRMENGYETNIGDRGGKMSGGERQRMSLARAILKNPPILILDEATSALDTESERLVQDALTKLMTNRTSIVIAHRLSTIKNADEIIVMQSGNIVERGNHAALLALNGVYKRLYDLQSFV